MYAHAHYAAHQPFSGRIFAVLSRLAEAFRSTAAERYPAALHRLPDHLLRDIGLERGDLPPVIENLISRADMVDSRTALDAYLAASTR